MQSSRESTSFGQLTRNLSIAANQLLRLDILKESPEFIIDGDAGDKEKLLITMKAAEKKFKLHLGSEIARGDVGFGGGGVLYNCGGRGEKLDVSASYGTHSATPLLIQFSKPILDRGRERLLKLSILNTMQNYLQGSNYKTRLNGASISYEFRNHHVHHELKYAIDWRRIFGFEEGASLSIRRDAGNTIKSSASHAITYNTLEPSSFPLYGTFLRFNTEFSGLGGTVRSLKHDVAFRKHFQIPSTTTSFYASFRIGHIAPFLDYRLRIIDKYQLGGPLSVRGFALNGLGPREGKDSLGGNTCGEAALGFTFPLSRSWKNLVCGHTFINFGIMGNVNHSASIADNIKSLRSLQPNVSAGIGLQVRFNDAKLELNIAHPIRMQSGAVFHKGIQIGIGVEFL